MGIIVEQLPMIESERESVPLTFVTDVALKQWVSKQPKKTRVWIEANGFQAGDGDICLYPAEGGSLAGGIIGLGDGQDPWAAGRLAHALPEASYRLESIVGVTDKELGEAATWITMAWILGAYRFDGYKLESARAPARLVWPVSADRLYVEGAANAAILTRNLVNIPAEDMGPAKLASVARVLAQTYGAEYRTIVGEDLLTEKLPAIHAVGRASANPPCLIDLKWGDEGKPKVTLVGKGVCFDTGGLDIKPSSGMRLMKKDMGGAATVLGLADWIMRDKLPVRLRVLIPAVENAIAGNAFRPGDVVRTRKGLTIEVGNTDAEGRVILADALTLACEDKPELLVDCATLTGAARVALGPELPALFTPNDVLARDLEQAGKDKNDPLWRLPLWQGYRQLIDSKVADISNSGESGFAGAITAALFLGDFVDSNSLWIHLDLYAWNPDNRPGRPAGGEAFTQRALFEVMRRRFG